MTLTNEDGQAHTYDNHIMLYFPSEKTTKTNIILYIMTFTELHTLHRSNKSALLY